MDLPVRALSQWSFQTQPGPSLVGGSTLRVWYSTHTRPLWSTYRPRRSGGFDARPRLADGTGDPASKRITLGVNTQTSIHPYMSHSMLPTLSLEQHLVSLVLAHVWGPARCMLLLVPLPQHTATAGRSCCMPVQPQRHVRGVSHLCTIIAINIASNTPDALDAKGSGQALLSLTSACTGSSSVGMSPACTGSTSGVCVTHSRQRAA